MAHKVLTRVIGGLTIAAGAVLGLAGFGLKALNLVGPFSNAVAVAAGVSAIIGGSLLFKKK